MGFNKFNKFSYNSYILRNENIGIKLSVLKSINIIYTNFSRNV